MEGTIVTFKKQFIQVLGCVFTNAPLEVKRQLAGVVPSHYVSPRDGT